MVADRKVLIMKLDDIIALAKQGYKPADIKELIELSKEPEPEAVIQGDVPEDGGESDHTTQEDNKPTVAAESPETIDYKQLYEEEHSKLLNAQKDNINQNLAGTEISDEQALNSLFENLRL